MKVLKGNPASPGIVLGKVWMIPPAVSKETTHQTTTVNVEQHWHNYNSAVQTANKALQAVIQNFPPSAKDQAAIFHAHQEMLVDEELMQKIETMIRKDHASASEAVKTVYTRFIELLSTAPDALIASRATDLKDVRNRLLQILNGQNENDLHDLPEPVILAAHELLPSEIVALDHQKVLGIITEVGGSTCHAAILARSYGIPAVLGAQGILQEIHQTSTIVLDGSSGMIVVHPEAAAIEQYQTKREIYLQEQQLTEPYLTEPASTACGEKVTIGLNISSPHLDQRIRYCDSIGLFRTEFMYMENDTLPTEEHQVATYRRVLTNAGGKPVTIRTLDAGGDKPIPALTHPKEDNPLLGNRGIRFSFTHPDLFRTQLRAILRASAFGELQIMFPMVSSIEELRQAKDFLEIQKTTLRNQDVAFDENLNIGVMIETPAIAFVADQLVQEVDFASVGTNDLTQYIHAADRNNAAVEGAYQSLSPAMLRLLANVVDAFREAGKPISVCGELAGEPMGVMALMALGFRSFSMEASRIAIVKRTLRQFTLAELTTIPPTLRSLTTQSEIIQLLNTMLNAHS